jgi:alpha-beta hydrolase superfamily lysophospholipase
MILQTETVDQFIDAGVHARFVKDVMATRDGAHPIAMVRKRLASVTATKAAVVLVHGFGQNRYAWHTSKRSFSNYLANLGYDVFNIDLRGRGRSKRFGARHDTGLDDYIREDVPAAIRAAMRVSGHGQVFLVGHSMGGLICYCVAGSIMREQVAGVISIGSPYRFGAGNISLRLGAPFLHAAHFSGLFDSDPPVPFRFFSAQMRRWIRIWDSPLVPLPIRVWKPRGIEHDILKENLAASFEHSRFGIALGIMATEAALKSHDGLIDYGLAFELADKPLLVIAGTDDQLAAPPSVRPVYDRSRSSDKTYREFPMGHIDLIMGREAPFTVWPLIRTWLGARVERLREATPKSA